MLYQKILNFPYIIPNLDSKIKPVCDVGQASKPGSPNLANSWCTRDWCVATNQCVKTAGVAGTTNGFVPPLVAKNDYPQQEALNTFFPSALNLRIIS
ncbi:MAG: hypothetical protein H6936_15770 [Burkholderiales bacterium]|nr:hypothetical protein [Nitrosomonas sp.]MCP5276269.1 hypothetical protein [Burkholderiales bacterium]